MLSETTRPPLGCYANFDGESGRRLAISRQIYGYSENLGIESHSLSAFNMTCLLSTQATQKCAK